MGESARYWWVRGIGLAVAAGVGIGVYFLFVRDTWERDNMERMLAMDEEVIRLVEAGKHREAVRAHRDSVDFVGTRSLQGIDPRMRETESRKWEVMIKAGSFDIVRREDELARVNAALALGRAGIASRNKKALIEARQRLLWAEPRSLKEGMTEDEKAVRPLLEEVERVFQEVIREKRD